MKAAMLILCCGLVVACGQHRETSYLTLAEAKADGAIDRGWIPEWFPPSAVQLHEAHHLDTNISYLSARFSESDPWAPPASCAQVSPQSVPRPAAPRKWWPDDVPPSKLVTHRHAYFECEDGKAFLAVSAEQGEIYYWRPHGI